MKIQTAIASGLLATGLFASAATAAPIGSIARDTISNDAPLVELVHNVHRACVLGQRGWHYHNRRGDRIECRPVRPGYRYWTWRSEGGRSGWWHSRERRWN
jgi:hypothetical protein